MSEVIRPQTDTRIQPNESTKVGNKLDESYAGVVEIVQFRQAEGSDVERPPLRALLGWFFYRVPELLVGRVYEQFHELRRGDDGPFRAIAARRDRRGGFRRVGLIDVEKPGLFEAESEDRPDHPY